MMGIAELPDAPWRREVFACLYPRSSQRAVIRNTPEDFRVTEALGYELTGEGEHLFLDITKRGANTAWVAEQISRAAGVRPLDVGYGGRKDRHAVTRQWFSAYLPGRDFSWRELAIEGVEIHGAQRHNRKLRPGEILHNRFELRLLIDDIDEEFISSRCEQISLQGFPNYFGAQRFGRDLHNLDLADSWLRLGQKPRANRGMLISAVRSWLFNLYLSRRIESGDPEPGELGPLYGKSRDPQAGEAELADTYRDWIAGLRKRGAKVAERPLMVRPEQFEWSLSDSAVTLVFSLGPGSYATSLLAELFLVEDAAL